MALRCRLSLIGMSYFIFSFLAVFIPFWLKLLLHFVGHARYNISVSGLLGFVMCEVASFDQSLVSFSSVEAYSATVLRHAI